MPFDEPRPEPVVYVPAGLTDEGLPVGLQVVGPRFSESRLLGVAKAFEEANPWVGSYPRVETGAEGATDAND